MTLLYKIMAVINRIIDDFKSSEKDKRRLMVLGFAGVFLLDYLMFCFHIEKNPLNIFPAIPLQKEAREIEIYVPYIEEMTLNKEKREAPVFEEKKRYVTHLFYEITRGSKFENTSILMPYELSIREIWFFKDMTEGQGRGTETCVIDLEAGIMKKKTHVLKGSEELFKKALAKTIKENIPDISDVLLVERGIPGRVLWDFSKNR